MTSRLPTSSQVSIHPRLAETVARHLQSHWAQPIHAHTQQTFNTLNRIIQQYPRPIVLDSGCGTGWASERLSKSQPDHWVIGIDRSMARLSKAPKLPNNGRLARADLADLWRLIAQAQWPICTHYVLYPNPYPKSVHLKKRWHGHPVWPDLLQVGKRLVMRTNSALYAEEWAMALALSHQADIQYRQLDASEVIVSPISAFEKKYVLSGHPLFEVTSRRMICVSKDDLQ